jgi:two-component system, cell cycle response regulator DivK
LATKGAKFIVALSLSKGAYRLGVLRQAQHYGFERETADDVSKKVLIVEDNELNLKLFTDLLRAHQYIVEPLRDGREALDKARAFTPDLVIMDIQMPHVSGLDLIERMQADATLKQIPVLAVTAYAGKGDEERIMGAGAKAYLSKPVPVMQFLAGVRAIIG